VVLSDLKEDKNVQFNFFEDSLRVLHVAQVATAIDSINHRFGRHTISVADTMGLEPKSKRHIQTVG
jgi:hypothetical protein